MQGTIVGTRGLSPEERRKGVGASESAAALGVSPRESSRELYLRKLGLLPDVEETESMREGKYYEPYIASEYERLSGRKVEATQICIKSATLPMFATLDALEHEIGVILARKARREDTTSEVLFPEPGMPKWSNLPSKRRIIRKGAPFS